VEKEMPDSAAAAVLTKSRLTPIYEARISRSSGKSL
jgi:hypothetical protein